MDVSPTIQHLHGRLRSITGTDPAAGSEISETVPARRRWRLLAVRFTLTADVTVIDRTVTLQLDDGSNIILHIISDTVQTASQVRTYEYKLQPVPQFGISGTFHIPFPKICLFAGCRIMTTTTNLQAGDNYSAPQLLVEEWIDP